MEMNEKILIATKNKDKFEIVKMILNSIDSTNYDFYNLYDFEYLCKDEKENGNVVERAYNKAKQIYSNIEENTFKYIIGIDDGIKMKGQMIENVKDYIKDIIDDRYLSEGEVVEIVRAYCFMKQNGEYTTAVTKIPFKYKKINKKLELKENTYPLSNVLVPLTLEKTVSEMDKEENNIYYLKYSKNQIEEVFK